jgi:hypothetical protein
MDVFPAKFYLFNVVHEYFVITTRVVTTDYGVQLLLKFLRHDMRLHKLCFYPLGYFFLSFYVLGFGVETTFNS